MEGEKGEMRWGGTKRGNGGVREGRKGRKDGKTGRRSVKERRRKKTFTWSLWGLIEVQL